MGVSLNNVEDVLAYHALSVEQADQVKRVREGARLFALVILRQVPEGQDQQDALGYVRRAMMLSNAAISTKGAV